MNGPTEGLARSADQFILKGATLLFAWLGEVGRATRDVDFLALGDLSEKALVDLIVDVCRHPVEDDGIVFDVDTIRVEEIRGADAYGGRRVTLAGRLGRGRIKVQVAVGIGDATVPEPEWLDLPTILGGPVPRLRGYRPETVVAEKFHAIVHLGVANTRLKDYYDLVALSHMQSFEAEVLRGAIEATFFRRGTDLPELVPPGLADGYASAGRRRQWEAFLDRSEVQMRRGLVEVLNILRTFLGPVAWAWAGVTSPTRWKSGQGWSP